MAKKSRKPYGDYWTKVLEPLIGGTVVGVLADKEDPDYPDTNIYYGLEIFKETDSTIKKYAVWFLRDEEGNGPGAFQLQVISAEKKKPE